MTICTEVNKTLCNGEIQQLRQINNNRHYSFEQTIHKQTQNYKGFSTRLLQNYRYKEANITTVSLSISKITIRL